MDRLVAGLAVALLLAACSAGRKFDNSHIKQLQAGMTFEEVVDILGPPYSMNVTAVENAPPKTVCTWMYVSRRENRTLTVSFANGRLEQTPSGTWRPPEMGDGQP